MMCIIYLMTINATNPIYLCLWKAGDTCLKCLGCDRLWHTSDWESHLLSIGHHHEKCQWKWAFFVFLSSSTLTLLDNWHFFTRSYIDHTTTINTAAPSLPHTSNTTTTSTPANVTHGSKQAFLGATQTQTMVYCCLALSMFFIIHCSVLMKLTNSFWY